MVKSLYGQRIQGKIRPLVEGPRTIFDAKEKAELFNEYFASQSSLDDSSMADRAAVWNIVVSIFQDIITRYYYSERN